MATIESVFSKNLYTTPYDYQKVQGVNGAKPRTYEGTVILAAGLTQKNGNNFPLLHAKDIQIGQVASERLTDKLSAYDAILRDLYGDISPTNLASYTSAVNTQSNLPEISGIDSLSDIALILNHRTETIDDRITDLRMWKTITIAAQSTGVTDLSANTTSIVADANNSSLTFASGNKWIKFAGIDGTTNKLTIAHVVNTIGADTATADLNNSGTFDISLLTWDEAGHITKNTVKTFTLPYNWKSITTSNSTGTSSLTTSDATINAASQIDTVTLAAKNKWILLAASDKTVSIAHAISTLSAGAHASNFTLAKQTPNFGSTVNVLIPSISFTTDAAGHVTAFSYSSSNAEIVIPKGSLTDTDTGNAITGLAFVDTTGALTVSRTNIGALAITGYSKGSSGAALAATDTLNTALSKLENQVSNEASTRSSADAVLDGRLDTLEGYNVNTRLNTLEGYNANTRLNTLEGYNTNTRLNTLEGYNADTRLTTLENYDLDNRVDTIEDNYLTKTNASATYLTKTDASSTYQTITGALKMTDVESAITTILANYDLNLKQPVVTASYASKKITARSTISSGSTAIIWLEKQVNTAWNTVGSASNYTTDTNKTYDITENATYRVAVKRTYNGQEAIGYSDTITVSNIS